MRPPNPSFHLPNYVENGHAEVSQIFCCIHISHGNNRGVTNHQALSKVQLKREHHLCSSDRGYATQGGAARAALG